MTDIQEELDSLPEEFVKCRGFQRHAWTAYTVVENPITRVFRVTEICERCKSTCWQKLDSVTGEPLTRRKIDYISGYRIRGHGRLPSHLQHLVKLEAYRLSVKVTVLKGKKAEEDAKTQR